MVDFMFDSESEQGGDGVDSDSEQGGEGGGGGDSTCR